MKFFVSLAVAFLLASQAFAADVVTKTVNWDRDLFHDHRPVPELTFNFTVTEESIITLSGYVGVIRRDVSPSYVIGVGLLPFLNGQRVFAASGKNIIDIVHHYETLGVAGTKVVQAGTYSLTFTMNAITDSAPGLDGLAEIHPGQNALYLRIEPT